MKMSKLAVLFAVACTSGAALAQTTHTLKVAHFLPASSNAQRNIIEPWCAQLASESAGRLKCQLYPSMQLGGTPAKLADMARNGVADIVWTAPAYSAGKFPRMEAMELPFMLPAGARAGNPIIWKYYEQYARDDFKGYKVLSVHGDGGMDIHTRGKAVANLDDLKNLKLRASSRTAAKLLQALGATPVSMPPAQMTESIAKGVVDGALASWEVVPPTKLDEVTDRHSAIPAGEPAFAYTVLAMLMNQRKFDSLPEDLQAIIERNSGPALNERFADAWDAFLDRARAATPGEQMVSITAPDYAAMRQAAAPVADAWAVDASGRGLDGKVLLDGARALSVGPR
ncbi:TRAP transporter substrate-binding protein [Metapseudomonas resinovorans]|uniref:Putative TRAP dicarboxylate transporter subunit DctP n=1 Tax=Metapseudomonas resinovorans NBRC 106553 TaxID=1245471 RepID=S6AGT0_METRE|nr:TRAP transporter substrate-binding protein [Pseudomonas resinovorans]BAN47370.1 putative TRAP dicarboxylate transporter subunit DctP [Pseudomonas resinovorans NBRC 106553]